MTDHDHLAQEKPPTAEDDAQKRVADWDRVDALEEPKKPRKRSWLDDPDIGGSGPQVAG